MPPRPTRCVYKESGQKCIRNGTGNPSLCRPHRIVFEDQARRAAEPKGPARRAASAFVDIAEDFLQGRPFDPTKVASAVSEFAWTMGGNYGQFSPDLEDAPRQAYQPPPDPRHAPRWHRDEPPPPPQGPDIAAIASARQTLGFGPRDPLTEDAIKTRRRQLSMRHHPDRGGSTARMAQINDAADTLLSTI